jgi:hypothetical protein
VLVSINGFVDLADSARQEPTRKGESGMGARISNIGDAPDRNQRIALLPLIDLHHRMTGTEPQLAPSNAATLGNLAAFRRPGLAERPDWWLSCLVTAKLVVLLGGIPDQLGLTAADEAWKLQFQVNVFWLKAARIVPKGGPRRDT